MCVDLLETIPTAVCTLQVYNCRFRTCASSYMCKHSYITASKVNAIPIYSSQFLWNLKICFSSSTQILWRWQDNPGGKFCEDGKITREAGCSLKLSGVFMRCTMPYFSISSMHLERNHWSEDIPSHQPTTDHITGTHICPHIRWCMHETREWVLCFLFFFSCWWLAEEAKRY